MRRSLFILLPQGRISACCVVQNQMGNFKFRLSNMIPSTWLSKLKHTNSISSSRKALLPSDVNQDRLFRHERPPPMPPRSPLPLDHAHRRKSYYFSRQFHEVQPRRPPTPPRRSTSKPRRLAHLRKPARRSSLRFVNTSVLACCSCRVLARFDLVRDKPRCPVLALPPDSPSSTNAIFPQSPSSFRHSSGLVPSSESFDKVVSWNNIRSSCRYRANFDGPVILARGFDRNHLSDLELPPVLTKSHKFNERVPSSRKGGENKKPVTTNNRRSSSSSSSVFVKVVKEETYRTVRANCEHKKPRPIVNLASSPAGSVRLRVNSPQVGSRKQSQAHHLGRKSVNTPVSSYPVPSLNPRTGRSGGASDGFVVVKSSADPWKDFRDSMVEMIVENDIRALKDLEDLLACYLTLNSDEYHRVIIGVFKQILFDFNSAC